MEYRQEGWRVERKEERKRGRHEGKVVTGRGRMSEVAGRCARRKRCRNIDRLEGRMI